MKPRMAQISCCDQGLRGPLLSSVLFSFQTKVKTKFNTKFNTKFPPEAGRQHNVLYREGDRKYPIDNSQ